MVCWRYRSIRTRNTYVYLRTYTIRYNLYDLRSHLGLLFYHVPSCGMDVAFAVLCLMDSLSWHARWYTITNWFCCTVLVRLRAQSCSRSIGVAGTILSSSRILHQKSEGKILFENKWSRVGRTFLFTPPPPTHLIQNAWFDANDHALLNRSNTRTTRANIGQRHVVRSCLPWKFEMCNEKIRDSTVGSYCFRIECPQARLVETLYEKQYVINSSSTISLFLVSSCVQY